MSHSVVFTHANSRLVFRRCLTVEDGKPSGGTKLIRSAEHAQWRRSSYCGSNACVEVAHVDDDAYLVRDAKDPDGVVLSFTAAEWAAFLSAVKAGEFDV